jgi:hypothetical protein
VAAAEAAAAAAGCARAERLLMVLPAGNILQWKNHKCPVTPFVNNAIREDHASSSPVCII